MYVVVGLGNPGKDYSNTRHNIGFNTLDLIAKRNNININKIKFQSVYGEGNISGEKILLVKPQTYMNNSGITVRDISQYYKVPMENIIVVVDDIDIDFSAVKIRAKGSAGSHNGLKSIISNIQGEDFPRVKVGIGKKHENQDLADFVLSRFSRAEQTDIDMSFVIAAEAVESIIKDGIDAAMNKYNTKTNKAQ